MARILLTLLIAMMSGCAQFDTYTQPIRQSIEKVPVIFSELTRDSDGKAEPQIESEPSESDLSGIPDTKAIDNRHPDIFATRTPVLSEEPTLECLDADCQLSEKNPPWLSKSESAQDFHLTRDLWDRIRAGFKLNLDVQNPRFEMQYNWYVRHPAYLNRTAKRAERYLHYIVEEVEKRGMPMELALLPIVESAFDPFAYSHGRASGIWQFIPGTGEHYGMPQNWWYDGRRDIVASTQGALNYLQDLANEFNGDWTLALASYNSGAGTVRRAIRFNTKKGRDTDFWSLKLPKETSAYVPKLLAIAKLVRDIDQHEFDIHSIENKPYFAIVSTQSQLDLAQAADLANIPVEEIYLLNPGFNRWATAPLGPHRLLVPIDQAETFNTNIKALNPDRRVTWKRYKVQRGNSLITIARKFKTTPAVIKEVNSLRNHMIRIGQALLIPSAGEKDSFYAFSANNRLKKQQNNIASKQSGSKVVHVVRTGDTFWDLSRKYKVGMRELAKWNGMAPTDPLKPGQKLAVWTRQPNTRAVQVNPVITRKSTVRKIGYKVRSGDSLAVIASKFRVSIQDIVAWNGINPKKYLQPGQRLTLFVDVTGG